MHAKMFGQCRHSGPNWETVMARALHCLGIKATDAEERAMVASFKAGINHWHSGVLFTSEEK